MVIGKSQHFTYKMGWALFLAFLMILFGLIKCNI